MSTRVVEAATGAKILPVPSKPNPSQQASAWQVYCSISADARAKFPEYAAIAARMIVVGVEDG